MLGEREGRLKEGCGWEGLWWGCWLWWLGGLVGGAVVARGLSCGWGVCGFLICAG